MADTFAMAELLKDEYRKTFEQITLYANLTFGNEQFVNDRMMNIYDMFIEAQENGKPVEKIVGADLEEFCKEYFKADSKGIWAKEIFKRLFHVAVIALVFIFIDYFMRGEGGTLSEATIDMKPILIGVFVGGVLITFGKFAQRKLMFRNTQTKPAAYYVALVALFLGGIGGLLVATKEADLNLNLFWAAGISGGYCVLYLVSTWIYRYSKYGSFRNPDKLSKEEKAQQKEFDEELTLQSDMVSSAKGMAKRFQRLQAKNQKQGKPEYTMEEFIKLMKKETQWGLGTKILWIVFPILCVAISTWRMWVAEGPVAATVVFAVTAVVLAFIYKLFWEALKGMFTAQRKVIEECEKRGVTIMQYVEGME